MQAEKLSVHLPADLARMVRHQVESGAFASDSEVIREALFLLQERERLRAADLDVLRRKIDAAAEDPDRLTPEDLRQRIARHLERGGQG